MKGNAYENHMWQNCKCTSTSIKSKIVCQSADLFPKTRKIGGKHNNNLRILV